MIIFLSVLLFVTSFPFSTQKSSEKYNPTTLVFPTRKHIPIRKATKFHLFLYVQNRVKVRDPQGIALARLDSWENPKTEKDDDEITIYGVNSGQNVLIYNSSMTSISVYGLKKRGREKLNNPHGIATAHWGDVYVADTGNNRLVKFHNPGKELRFQKALLTGALRRPVGVALAADSSLYVSDTENNRLLLLRADTLQAVIAKPGRQKGSVWHPTGVAAISANDRWSYWKENFVVVIDLFGKRIQKFDPSGRLLQTVRSETFGYPNANLQYAAIDYYGNIWITDKHNHCVHKFDRKVNYLDTFGRKGNGAKEFNEPRGIAIHKRFGQVLIAEKESVQYYWIGTDVKRLKAFRDADGFLTIDYFLTERSYVTLEVFDKRGKLVKKVLKETARESGKNRERFSGDWQPLPFIFQNGARIFDSRRFANLPKGDDREYRLRFTFSATYSSYTYFSKEMELWVRF